LIELENIPLNRLKTKVNVFINEMLEKSRWFGLSDDKI